MLWRKALIYWRSSIVFCAIAYGCLLRKPIYTLPPINNGDKWVHWFAFMALTLTLLLDSRKAKLEKWKMWILATIFPILYGGVIEILQEQYFYPRSGELEDWLADCIGVLVGVCVWFFWQKWYERRVVK